MKSLIVRFVFFWVLWVSAVSLTAQSSAALQAQMNRVEEQVKRLSGQLTSMEENNADLRRRVQSLEDENRSLRKKLNDSSATAVDPADLREITKGLENQIKAVDEKRVQDDKALQKEFNDRLNKLADLLKQGGGASSAAPVVSGRYKEYTVQSGDTISAIRRAANSKLGANIRNDAELMRVNGITDAKDLQVGQIIKIPLP